MRKLLLWFAWVFMLVVYVATIAALCREGDYWPLAFAALNLSCCVFLFFAEGFEVAFCMLWPERESAEESIRTVLRDLDSEFILAQRQVIVVVTITVVSITTGALEWIVIPGLGKVASYGAPHFFSLAFVTSTVLWFSQVFPKRVAARDPVRFWNLTEWLLKPISIAGRILDLPAPSDELVAWWDRLIWRAQSHCTEMQSPWATCDCAVCNPNVIAEIAHRDEVACCCSICAPAEPSLL